MYIHTYVITYLLTCLLNCLLFLAYRKRIGMLDTTCEVKRLCGRVTSAASETALQGAVKRRATSTWCPWSTDSDDDDKTTSNSTSGSRYTSAGTETAADNARKRLIGGRAGKN